MLINQTGLKCSESTFSYLLDIFPIPRSILSLKTWNVLIYFTVCIPRYVAPCVLHVAAVLVMPRICMLALEKSGSKREENLAS